MRSRVAIAVVAIAGLAAVSGAAAELIDGYTAAGTPAHVKPVTSEQYTVALTNTSPDTTADRASIGIPAGFVVAPTVEATATCGSSTWIVESPVPSADGKITVRRQNGSENNLCPGGTLTVVFSATSPEGEGSYVWATELVRGEDTFVLSGNQPSVQVDGTAPVAAISSGPANPTNITSATFAFSANEPAAFTCKLDSGSFADCTSPKSYAVGNGAHTFTVQATDSAGNTGAETAYTWTVDTVAPTATITEKPTSPTNNATATFSFSSSEPGSFECSLDDGEFSGCTSPKSYPGLGDGSHTFKVRATDGAGNTGPPASHDWLVDAVSPVATISQKPDDPSNVKSPTFGFAANELATFECKLDSGSFSPCTSPKAYASLVDGSHMFTVRATDPAGNTGPETSYAWTVDTIAPAATITQKPPHPTNNTTANFAFSANEPAAFRCKLDGGSFADCASPKSYAVGNGAHTFTVQATDTAGNTGAETAYTWTVDTVAPTATITQKPTNPTSNTTASFGFSSSEPATFECSLDNGDFSGCTSPKSYAGLADGSHTFNVRATDGAGNTGPATTQVWTVDTRPPTVTITKAPNDPSGVSSASFEFSANEAASFQCELDAGGFAGCTSPKAYTNLPDRVHTFKVKATDTAGNASEAAQYDWLVETDLPVVTLTATPDQRSGSSAATFFFTVNKSATLECKLDAGAFAACTSPKSYSGLGDGSHTFAVRGNGTGGTGPSTVYTWSIDTAGPTSAITQRPNDPTNNRTATFVFGASEPATFQCRLDDAPFANCSSPQVYSDLGDGRHTFVVKATDIVLNSGPETAYVWTIESRAPAVTVMSAPRPLGNSKIATLAFAADEPATFQCNLDGRGFEPCSSPASYGGLGDGAHGFTVRASDTAGNIGAASHAWTIDATPPETTLDVKPPATTTSTVATFRFSANERATFECQLDRGSFSPCSSPKRYARLARGAHRFAVRGIDAADNIESTPSSARWTVGRTVRRTAASSALLSPTAGSRVTRPPLLRWRPVPRARYYNVQLFRAGRKILTAWPTRPRFQLRPGWRFNGRAQRLLPGVYRWYVWPGFGRPTARRYGPMLGASTFVVTRARSR